MPNALTRDVGFKVGPVLLEVLAKHYFEKRKEDGSTAEPVKLRKDEILFDEAFNLVKSFLNTASWHTVEDLQAFSNTRTPSPPWVKVVRLFVPMSSCDEAATHLIRVLGGEEFCRQLVGGIKWWQVRGLPGVDGQWIVAKKDWREAKKKEKIPTQKQSQSTTDSSEEEEGIYNKDMDAMRCILFLHGGGFYFGSVDQERYSIQRLARKINGRVFAINYRLAPQYPFPCALQDALAAYLYLIRPPPGSPHTPVDPAHIVVAGDSAGGALSLALLQLVRDAGLPAPAGGLLISPWCDLTHSFPSIHLNTSTDVIPDCGLSFHKPSTLWPPPSEEVSSRVHASLRHRIRQAFKLDGPAPYNPTDTVISQHDHTDSPTVPPTLSTFSPDKVPVHVGSTTHLPLPSESDGGRKICITTEKNERLEIDRQIHFYTENTLLTHPLISTSLSYLGGLPPLFIITGDKEVLRDEGIYSAHKAANPHKFPISDSVKKIYPPFRNLRSEDMIPTSVHLQVYDDAPHVLPILFAFTTPAKFCFRSMAAFTKFVTNMSLPPPVLPLPAYVSTSPAPSISDKTGDSESGANSKTPSLVPESNPPSRLSRRLSRSLSFKMPTMLRHRSMSSTFRRTSDDTPGSPGLNSGQLSPRRGQFEWPSSPSSSILVPPPTSSLSPVNGSEEADVGGPRFGVATTHVPTRGEHTAGEPSTYSHIKDFQKWECGMIRERVGIDGVIRPLEPENELLAMQVPIEIIGNMSELTLRRCIDYQGRFDKKFAHTYKQVEKHRRRNLERSKQDTIKQLSNLRQTIISKDAKAGESRGNSEVNVSTGGQPNGDKGRSGSGDSGFKELLLSTPGWSWAWALDEHENPPPSSIVSRRDTEEARKLAESADLALLGQEHTFSGNNLWSVVVNFLTITPGKAKVPRTPGGVVNPGTEQEDKEDKPGSRFSLSRVFKTDQQAQKAGKA